MSVATLPQGTVELRSSGRAKLLRDLLRTLSGMERAYLSGVSWPEYENLMTYRDNQRPGVRIQYDNGELEIMATSFPHDNWKHMLSIFVSALAEELNVRIVGAGNMSISRKDLNKGFEPDACFYIRNYRRAIPVRELDFAKDPPPDLAIEIEYSRTIVERLPIYAAFKVPEIWRFDGDTLKVLVLTSRRKYAVAARSPVFPTVPLEKVVEFIHLADSVDQTTILQQFRAWVRNSIQKH